MMKLLRKLIPEDSWIRLFYSWTKAILARLMYGNPSKDLVIIGVTGTDGKTSTTQFTTQLLEALNIKVAMISSESLRIAGERRENASKRTTLDPFSTQKFLKEAKEKGCSVVILEVSSHALVQGRLFGIHFDGAIVTNISQEHGNYHKTLQEYAEVKSRLFELVTQHKKLKPKILVLNQNIEFFDIFARIDPAITKTYGLENETSSIHAKNIEEMPNESHFVMVQEDHSSPTTLRVPGRFNIENILAASLIARFLGAPLEKIAKAIPAVKGVPGRLEEIENPFGFKIIVDFALTPGALQKLLEFAVNTATGKVVLVFGCAGGNHDKIKRPILGNIASTLADYVVITEDETYGEDNDQIMRDIQKGFRKNFIAFTQIPDRKEAIHFALKNAQAGDTVLITGMGAFNSRNNGNEEIPWNDTECVKEWINLNAELKMQN